jgi:hypothetical protein
MEPVQLIEYLSSGEENVADVADTLILQIADGRPITRTLTSFIGQTIFYLRNEKEYDGDQAFGLLMLNPIVLASHYTKHADTILSSLLTGVSIWASRCERKSDEELFLLLMANFTGVQPLDIFHNFGFDTLNALQTQLQDLSSFLEDLSSKLPDMARSKAALEKSLKITNRLHHRLTAVVWRKTQNSLPFEAQFEFPDNPMTLILAYAIDDDQAMEYWYDIAKSELRPPAPIKAGPAPDEEEKKD